MRNNEKKIKGRWYVFCDDTLIASTATKETALQLVKQYQKDEKHYLLRSAYSIMYGNMKYIDY